MHQESGFNETELLMRVAQGDQQAFHVLFTQYWPQVYGTSLHLTRSPELAKDLAQDIFLKLWLNRSKLNEVKKLDSYLYILSRNLIMDQLRKKVFDRDNLDFLRHHLKESALTAQDRLEHKELEQTLLAAVNSLSGKVGEVFRLSRIQGLTHDQIAALLNISVVSSKTYIVRALQDIRRYMSIHGPQTPLLLLLLMGLQK